MATNNCIPVQFLETSSNAFYFGGAESESEVEADSYTDSFHSPTYNLQCKDNKFLLLNNDGQFQLQDLSAQEQCRPDCRFNIHIYNDSSLEQMQGISVMLYTNRNGKKIMACCRDHNEIYPEAMDLPREIAEAAHKALFCLTKLSGEKYMFESIAYPNKFLGFEPVEGRPSLKKLVLRMKGPDGVDDSSEVNLNRCNE
ncbi:uncharacterized protein LOC118299517 isoform X1 [Scophthalmus maximus]|uniref:uncharacterized protein LOC118299517 isoform X1 n=1 Tax=Scophthalmus maximus TaxID=52904 RepID=UPI001FA8C5C9|nr:uncharacterized protein LOC118299517 isoform X1 [Scophthalmus maximus]XP_047191816.1 uncharacterized protein LOC118299517 isoform X1 [Scophthalmus maximus]XP_047191817.1 uncharacterized protein LOC118299517 isoform X1 [Scophthalmus maximus]